MRFWHWNNLSFFTPLPQFYKWKITPPERCFAINQRLPSCHTSVIKLLLYGDDSLDLVTNTLILNTSVHFISSSIRFDGPLLWDYYIRRLTRGGRGGGGEVVCPALFQKLEKNALVCGKKCPDCGLLLWSSFKMQFLRVSRRKNRRFFPCGAFLSCIVGECLSKRPNSKIFLVTRLYINYK